MKKVIYFLLMVLISSGCKKDKEEEPPQSAEKKITEFTAGPVSGTLDEANKTVTVDLASGTDVTALVPAIKVSPGATVSPRSGIAQDFTGAVTCTVTAEDNSSVAYTVTVHVPKSKEARITSLAFEALNPAVSGTINQTDQAIVTSIITARQ